MDPARGTLARIKRELSSVFGGFTGDESPLFAQRATEKLATREAEVAAPGLYRYTKSTGISVHVVPQESLAYANAPLLRILQHRWPNTTSPRTSMGRGQLVDAVEKCWHIREPPNRDRPSSPAYRSALAGDGSMTSKCAICWRRWTGPAWRPCRVRRDGFLFRNA